MLDPSHAPMSTLVNPARDTVPHYISQLTGITNSMVSAPAVPSFARAAELMEEFVEAARARGGGAPVLLAGPPPHCCLVLYHVPLYPYTLAASLPVLPAGTLRRVSLDPLGLSHLQHTRVDPGRHWRRPCVSAAHNARQFDAGFLQAEYRRLGRELPDSWRFVDTLPMARKTVSKALVGKYTLGSLASYFEYRAMEGETAHRALADVRMLGGGARGPGPGARLLSVRS